MKVAIDGGEYVYDDETERWSGPDAGVVVLLNDAVESAELFSAMPDRESAVLAVVQEAFGEGVVAVVDPPVSVDGGPGDGKVY